ncbi:RagB/SusD family nutrient uptake outer membrane protein, partial [Pedobacter sp.]|uniref:RagB/SusD family nutrient uptake outer membrane protein n=1 Tax=Pedobacter sp. TaxID=1411316 RepID=UPI003D7F528C
SDISAYDTPERISNLMNGLYATFKGGGFWGSQYLYYSEARAGDFVATNLNPTRGGLSYMMTVDPGTSDVSAVWTQGYQIINACNVFIANMEEKGGAVVGTAINGNYVGEARFLRSLAYYYLLQLYAEPFTKNQGASPGLPLRLTPNKGLGDYNLKRSTVAEVYKQIIDDMNFAETNVPEKYTTAALNTTRAHRNTVIAAKTKVYLSMGDYANVVTAANKIVPVAAPFIAPSGVLHALQADVTTVFKAPYTSTESIFSMPFTSNDAPGTSLGNAYLPDGSNATGLGRTGGGDFYLFEGGIVADAGWKATDKRRELTFSTAAGVNKGRLWSTKYSSGSPYTDYVPVIRYAEVLLNLAEALTNLNGVDARALALVNAVRKRSDATTTITAAAKQELLDKIIVERHIEFLGEGIRNADLMRLKLPIPAKTPLGSSPIPKINPDDPNYLWPIPNNESLYNKDI